MGKKYMILSMIFIVLLLISSLALFGCGKNQIKDNQVYLINDQGTIFDHLTNEEQVIIDGIIPFQKHHLDDQNGRVFLTISRDEKYVFFMEPVPSLENPVILKGEPNELVRIIMVEEESQEEKIVAEDIPFVSLVKWNITGKVVAFGGGNRLTIYDTRKEGLLLEDKLEAESINYFFWSPKEENKIYSESPNLSNGSIYYLNSQKKVEAYETKEEIYYKGELDQGYYFATRWFTSPKESSRKGDNNNHKKNGNERNDGIRTIIIDQNGEIVKILGLGRFRDAYGKSLLQVDDSNFGLYFTPDINNPENIKTLTEKYVYDVKFVDQGKIAYILGSKSMENNFFTLYILDKNGKEIKQMQVTGSKIALSPDGKTGYIGGPAWEKISFSENQLEKNLLLEETGVNADEFNADEMTIFNTIRQAINIFYKFELTGTQDWVGVEKYFKDIDGLNKRGYLDIVNIFQTNPVLNNHDIKSYTLEIKLGELTINTVGEAFAQVETSAFVNSGGGFTMDFTMELFKINKEWFIISFTV